MGPGRQIESALDDSKWQRRQQTDVAADPVSNRGLRLRHQTKHSPIAATEKLRRHGCSGRYERGRSVEVEPRRNFSLKRPRRSVRAALRSQDGRRFNGQETDLWNLSRPSNPRFRFRWIDIQTEIRSSRRESTGKRFEEGKGGDNRA